MRLKTLFFLVATMIIHPLLSQDKYGPGYYLANGTDTIKGFIEYRSNYNYEFKFRKSLKDETKTLTIEEVGQFGLDYGMTYRKLDFALEDLSTKPVFAQVLVQGDIDLYEYQSRLFLDGGEMKKFIIAKGKGTITEEIQKNYQKNAGTFNILFFDCPSVKEEAIKSTISKTTLSNLIIKYHECKNLPYEHLNQIKNRQIKYGFYVGVTLTNLSYSGSTYLSRSSFNNPSKNLVIGIISQYSGRKASSIISLQQELFFSKESFEGSSYIFYDISGYQITESSISSISYFKICLQDWSTDFYSFEYP